MQFIKIVTQVLALLRDPEISGAIQKLIEWFSNLTPEQQLAYASRFEATDDSPIGESCDPDCCPECDDPDCQCGEQALLEAAAE